MQLWLAVTQPAGVQIFSISTAMICGKVPILNLNMSSAPLTETYPTVREQRSFKDDIYTPVKFWILYKPLTKNMLQWVFAFPLVDWRYSEWYSQLIQCVCLQTALAPPQQWEKVKPHILHAINTRRRRFAGLELRFPINLIWDQHNKISQYIRAVRVNFATRTVFKLF